MAMTHFGMERVNDPSVAARLIDELDVADDAYSIEEDESGLTLVSGQQSARPGYRQQIFAWSDRLEPIARQTAQVDG
jgi:hypothetical protein